MFAMQPKTIRIISESLKPPDGDTVSQPSTVKVPFMGMHFELKAEHKLHFWFVENSSGGNLSTIK